MQLRPGFRLALKRQESLATPKPCQPTNGCSISSCYTLLSCSSSPLCWKLGSLRRPDRERGVGSSAAAVYSSSAQSRLGTELRSGKMSKIRQHSHPHLSCLLVSHPEVMWVPALCHECSLYGYPHIAFLAVWPCAGWPNEGCWESPFRSQCYGWRCQYWNYGKMLQLTLTKGKGRNMRRRKGLDAHT